MALALANVAWSEVTGPIPLPSPTEVRKARIPEAKTSCEEDEPAGYLDLSSLLRAPVFADVRIRVSPADVGVLGDMNNFFLKDFAALLGVTEKSLLNLLATDGIPTHAAIVSQPNSQIASILPPSEISRLQTCSFSPEGPLVLNVASEKVPFLGQALAASYGAHRYSAQKIPRSERDQLRTHLAWLAKSGFVADVELAFGEAPATVSSAPAAEEEGGGAAAASDANRETSSLQRRLRGHRCLLTHRSEWFKVALESQQRSFGAAAAASSEPGSASGLSSSTPPPPPSSFDSAAAAGAHSNDSGDGGGGSGGSGSGGGGGGGGGDRALPVLELPGALSACPPHVASLLVTYMYTGHGQDLEALLIGQSAAASAAADVSAASGRGSVSSSSSSSSSGASAEDSERGAHHHSHRQRKQPKHQHQPSSGRDEAVAEDEEEEEEEEEGLVDGSHLIPLAHAAEELLLPELASKALDECVGCVDVENAPALLSEALRFQHGKLKSACTGFMVKHLKACAATPWFQALVPASTARELHALGDASSSNPLACGVELDNVREFLGMLNESLDEQTHRHQDAVERQAEAVREAKARLALQRQQQRRQVGGGWWGSSGGSSSGAEDNADADAAAEDPFLARLAKVDAALASQANHLAFLRNFIRTQEAAFAEPPLPPPPAACPSLLLSSSSCSPSTPGGNSSSGGSGDCGGGGGGVQTLSAASAAAAVNPKPPSALAPVPAPGGGGGKGGSHTARAGVSSFSSSSSSSSSSPPPPSPSVLRPTYEWQAVLPGQSVPAGLEVRLDLGLGGLVDASGLGAGGSGGGGGRGSNEGGGASSGQGSSSGRKARIPPVWRLSVWVESALPFCHSPVDSQGEEDAGGGTVAGACAAVSALAPSSSPSSSSAFEFQEAAEAGTLNSPSVAATTSSSSSSSSLSSSSSEPSASSSPSSPLPSRCDGAEEEEGEEEGEEEEELLGPWWRPFAVSDAVAHQALSAVATLRAPGSTSSFSTSTSTSSTSSTSSSTANSGKNGDDATTGAAAAAALTPVVAVAPGVILPGSSSSSSLSSPAPAATAAPAPVATTTATNTAATAASVAAGVKADFFHRQDVRRFDTLGAVAGAVARRLGLDGQNRVVVAAVVDSPTPLQQSVPPWGAGAAAGNAAAGGGQGAAPSPAPFFVALDPDANFEPSVFLNQKSLRVVVLPTPLVREVS